MTREEFENRWGFVYRQVPTQFLEDLKEYWLSLPPAEGAEAILHRHIDKQSMDELSVNVWPDILEAMTEFAAQQPTAEGAEEILANLETYYDFKFHWVERDRIIKAMHEFATLHAQKIVDKMVSERLREELIKYMAWYNGHETGADEELIDEYLSEKDSEDEGTCSL